MKEITFTGRDVPIRETSATKGKSTEYIKREFCSGLIDSGYVLKSDESSRCSFFCPDKLV